MQQETHIDIRWAFFSADIELTNVCHGGCRMCPRSALQRPVAYWDGAAWEHFVKRLAPWQTRLTFSGFGDPLLHPEWDKCVEVAWSAGLSVGIVVHPASLTEERIERLAKLPLREIELSFPTVFPELFSHFCEAICFDEALQRTLMLRNKLFSQKKLSRLVCVGLELSDVLLKLLQDKYHKIIDCYQLYQDFWAQYSVRSRVFPCHSRGGYLHPSVAKTLCTSKIVTSSQHCGLLALHAFIAADHSLLACCHDLTGETRIGHVCFDSLETLAKQKLLLAQNVPWELCLRCDEFRRHWPLPQGVCFVEPAERRKFLQKLTHAREF